ncbi:MAG: hypothetical protein QM723_22410 [Myxococcaceae bacterium]
MLATLLATAAFGDAPLDRLKPIAGHWKATTASGKTLNIDYRFISADTVLVEAYNAGSPRETMTVFHADKTDLLATHYCAQGNQPRLKLQPGKDLVFTFLDATNLSDPQASHLIRLELKLEKDGSLTRTETYREQGKDEVTTLTLKK